MKTTRVFGSLCVFTTLCAVTSLGQSTVFSDDMSGTFSTHWTAQSTASGSVDFSSGVLLIDNNGNSGQTWAYTNLSDFGAPFNIVLSSNEGEVTWAFNMRTLSSDPSNNNRLAFVLAASSSDFTTGSGYAVRVGGNSPSTDPLELVYYTGGVNGSIVSIASGASMTANQYASVRIAYDPKTNMWRLYGETASSWTNPSLISSLLGSGINSTGTSITMTSMGVWSLHTTTASQDRTFDNISVTAIPEPATCAAIIGALALAGVVMHRRRQTTATL